MIKTPKRDDIFGRYLKQGFALIATILIVDQYTKYLMVEKILRTQNPADSGFWQWLITAKPMVEFMTQYGSSFQMITVTPFLNFTMVWNQGVSFGLLSSDHNMMVYLLIALALFISTVLLGWLLFTQKKMVAVSLSLMIGGAIGNVWDRARFGAVADFVDLHVNQWHWPAFNLADSCIVIGAGLLIIDSFLEKDEKNVAEK